MLSCSVERVFANVSVGKRRLEYRSEIESVDSTLKLKF